MRPVTAVTNAMAEGKNTPTAIAQATGLSMDTVSAVLEQLTRIGYLQERRDDMACDSCGMHCGGKHPQCSGLRTLTLQPPPSR